jgi:hypothetical protein
MMNNKKGRPPEEKTEDDRNQPHDPDMMNSDKGKPLDEMKMNETVLSFDQIYFKGLTALLLPCLWLGLAAAAPALALVCGPCGCQLEHFDFCLQGIDGHISDSKVDMPMIYMQHLARCEYLNRLPDNIYESAGHSHLTSCYSSGEWVAAVTLTMNFKMKPEFRAYCLRRCNKMTTTVTPRPATPAVRGVTKTACARLDWAPLQQLW